MNKIFRFLLFLAVLIAVGIFAGQKAVLASPPPPVDVTGEPTTESGQYQLGGCVTGSVKSFKPGIKLNAALLDGWNAYPTVGLPPMPDYYWTLPGGPADIFTCLVNIKLFDGETVLKSLPAEKGSAEVCLQTPPGKTGSIYFLDKFFNDKPVWVMVGGPFSGGMVACVPAVNSGVYAFYAPDPAGHPAPPQPVTSTTAGTHRVGSIDVPNAGVVTVTQPGGLVLGGCVTGNIKDLPGGDTIQAELVHSWPGYPDLPTGVGEFYRCVVKLQFYEASKLIDKIPVEKGNVTICFAVPPQSNGTIYFLDKYLTKEAVWIPLAGPFPTGIACGPADQTGLYGMVDKRN
jgi:hypothetical protein